MFRPSPRRKVCLLFLPLIWPVATGTNTVAPSPVSKRITRSTGTNDVAPSSSSKKITRTAARAGAMELEVDASGHARSQFDSISNREGSDSIDGSAEVLEVQDVAHAVTKENASSEIVPQWMCNASTPTYKCSEQKNGLIGNGTRCTLVCAGEFSGYKPEPASADCTCTFQGTCTLQMSAFKCESNANSCFPRSARLLRSSGEEVGIDKVAAGDPLMGLSEASTLGSPRELASATYFADSHDSYPEARDGSLHRFIEIRHACGGSRTLRVTADHLIFVVPGLAEINSPRLKPAGSLRTGKDFLLSTDCEDRASAGQSPSSWQLGPSLVTDMHEVMAEGLYNPVTSSYSAIVDGVATSNAALATPAIKEAFEATPVIHENAETVVKWIMLLPKILTAVGVPWSWLNSKPVHTFYMGALDAVFRTVAWMAAKPVSVATDI